MPKQKEHPNYYSVRYAARIVEVKKRHNQITGEDL